MYITLQLRNGDEKAEFMVDGWNAWFYDDLKNLVGFCRLKIYSVSGGP